jgi:hypothetical protein
MVIHGYGGSIMRFLVALAAMVILFVGVPTTAQETLSRDPLLNMLSYAPDTLDVRSDVLYYQDLEAALSSRPYLAGIETAEDFLSQEYMVRSRFLDRLFTCPCGRAFQLLEEPDGLAAVRETTGLDIFDVQRTLMWGYPGAVIWSGTFDPDVVEAAHVARGYQPAVDDGVNVWCGPSGCAEVNVDGESNVADMLTATSRTADRPFLPPDENTIVSAHEAEALVESAQARADIVPSLADAPDYRALAEAITDPDVYDGSLVGAAFLPWPLMMYPTYGVVTRWNLLRTDAEREAFLANPASLPLLEGYGQLPPYLSGVIADRQEGDMQVAVVALTYADAETAGTAANELAGRLATFSRAMAIGNADVPNELSAYDGEAYVQSRVFTSSDSDVSVAVAEVWYPAAPLEEQLRPFTLANPPPTRFPRFPALYFRNLMGSLNANALYPVWVEMPTS